MTDLHVIIGDANSRNTTITAVSKRGHSFLFRAFQKRETIAVPKTSLPDIHTYVVSQGLVWQTFTPSAYAALYPHKAS